MWPFNKKNKNAFSSDELKDILVNEIETIKDLANKSYMAKLVDELRKVSKILEGDLEIDSDQYDSILESLIKIKNHTDKKYTDFCNMQIRQIYDTLRGKTIGQSEGAIKKEKVIDKKSEYVALNAELKGELKEQDEKYNKLLAEKQKKVKLRDESLAAGDEASWSEYDSEIDDIDTDLADIRAEIDNIQRNRGTVQASIQNLNKAGRLVDTVDALTEASKVTGVINDLSSYVDPVKMDALGQQFKESTELLNENESQLKEISENYFAPQENSSYSERHEKFLKAQEQLKLNKAVAVAEEEANVDAKKKDK